MKKNIRRSLLVGLTALCIGTASLAIFTACGSKPKLALEAGEGGTLSKDSYSVKAGADLSEFLKDKSPEVTTQGLTFAGWYDGNKKIEAGMTMPKEGLTLTAKYTAGYRVELYLRDSAESEAVLSTEYSTGGTAFWHEKLTIAPTSYEFPVNYSFNASDAGNVLSVDKLEVGFTFKVYLLLDSYYISFLPNAPEGVEIGGKMPTVGVGRGKTYTLPEARFTAPDDYLMIGWSKGTESVEYHVGDTITVDSDMTLYPIWLKGRTDIFEGDDFVFIDEETDTAYLHRAGLPEKKGSYDADLRIFTFEEEGRTVLEGKLVGETGYYYVRDLEGETFTFGGKRAEAVAKEELTFGAKGSATYTVTPAGEASEPVAVKGSYSVDPDTGDYLFEGEGKSFYFTLFVDRTLPEAEQNRFVRTSDVEEEVAQSERGFYALWSDNENGYDATQAFQLDGMYDSVGYASAGLYQFVGSEYRRAVTTYYGRESEVVDHSDDLPGDLGADAENYALLRSSDDYVLFRLYETEPFTANGRTFKGILRLEDGYRGEYGDYGETIEEGITSLTLDGFGNATWNGVKTPYSVKTLEAHGTSFPHIVMDPKGQSPSYIQFYSMAGAIYYESTKVQPKVVEVTNSLYKSFEYFAGGDGGITLYDGGYFYFYNDTDVAVYTYFTDVFDGVTQYSRGIDYGILTAKEGGVFGYESLLLGSGLLGEGEALFDIRFTKDGKIETSLILATFAGVDVTVGGKKLTVDKWGDLTYGGDTYAYGEYTFNDIYDYYYSDENDEGYVLREYFFGDNEVVLRASDADYAFDIVVGERDLLELVMKRYPGQSENFERIYFIEGLPTAIGQSKRAGILLLVSDGETQYEQVLLFGDVTYSPTDRVYKLQLEAPEDDDLEIFYNAYGGEDGLFFTVETFEGRLAAVCLDYDLPDEAEAEDGSTLEFDYYGNATYTPARGKAFTGRSDLLATYTDKTTNVVTALFSVTSEEKEEMFFFVSHNGGANPSNAQYTLSVVTAPEVGDYAYMTNETGSIYFGDYIVFFGAGQGQNIFYQTYVDGTGKEIRIFGKYQPTGEVISLGDGLAEYRLTYTNDDDEEVVTYIAVGAVEIRNSNDVSLGEKRIYVERIMPMGNYYVAGGGSVYGDGYSMSEYTDDQGIVWMGEFGREILIDTSPKMSEYRVEEGDHSKDGTQLFFKAYYVLLDGETYELSEEQDFLFDVRTEGEAIWLERRDDISATYAIYENGTYNEENLIYLDGHGNATITRGGKVVKGTYDYDDEIGSGVILPDSGEPFEFRVFTLSAAGDRWYLIVDTAEENVYINEDWSVLSLGAPGSYGDDSNIYSGVYSERYGASHYGIYEYLTDTLVRFGNNQEIIFFKVTEKGTFSVVEDDYVIEDGVLFGYQGSTYLPNGLRIPDGVKVIDDDVFSYMYIMFSLDLNEVEKIGARAFYQTYIGANELNSNYVTEIGDEAFYTDNTYDYAENMTAFNFVSNVNMPALKTIGARAFYYCNQMRAGTIVLRDIEFIGEQAFMHIVNPESGTMVLDLTRVTDLSKLTIAETAFDDMMNGAYNPNGSSPVRIRIKASQSSQTAQWPEKIKAWISPVNDSSSAPAGQSIMNFGPAVTKDICSGGSWTEADDRRRSE